MTTGDDQGESQAGPIHIPISPAGQRFGLVSLGLGIPFLIVMLVIRPDGRYTTPEVSFVLAGIGLIFASGLLARFLYIQFKGEAGVVVSKSYLRDLGTPLPFGDLEFSDVVDVRVAKRRKTLSQCENVWVVVTVKNPKKYIEVNSFFRKWLVRKLNVLWLGSPVAFQAGFLAVSADRFVSLLRRNAGLDQ